MKKKKNITISDIARLAGVSKTTVSFYLNGKRNKMSAETCSKIEEIIQKTNYHPNTMARSLNSKQTNLIGVIIGDIANTYANQIVKGIEDCSRQNGYQLIVGSSNYKNSNENLIVRSMISMGVDGFIVQPTVYFEPMWAQIDIDKPIVCFDSPTYNESEGLWVKTNTYDAVKEACASAVSRGYKRFILVMADPYVLATRMERSRGFSDALDPYHIHYDTIVAGLDTEPEELRKQLLPYLVGHTDICVFVFNNWLLTKVYLALKDLRQYMPDSLGLIGFDSLEWTDLSSPSITTIVQPAYEEGQYASRILIDQIENRGKETPRQVLKCWINERDSTKKKAHGVPIRI